MKYYHTILLVNCCKNFTIFNLQKANRHSTFCCVHQLTLHSEGRLSLISLPSSYHIITCHYHPTLCGIITDGLLMNHLGATVTYLMALLLQVPVSVERYCTSVMLFFFNNSAYFISLGIHLLKKKNLNFML